MLGKSNVDPRGGPSTAGPVTLPTAFPTARGPSAKRPTLARSPSAQGRARRHNGRQAFMKTLQELLDLRFGDIGAVPETLAGNEAIRRLAGRGVVRASSPSRCLRPCSIRWLPWRYHPLAKV